MPQFAVDRVFRDKHNTAMKYDGAGNWVCCYDQGVKRKLRMTCSRCKICWRIVQAYRIFVSGTEQVASV